MASLYYKDPRIGSRVEEILVADIDDTSYDGITLSRIEKILLARMSGGTYTGPVISRIEKYLVEAEDISPILSRIEEQIMDSDYNKERLSRIEWLIGQMHHDEWVTFNLVDNYGNPLTTNTGSHILGRERKRS